MWVQNLMGIKRYPKEKQVKGENKHLYSDETYVHSSYSFIRNINYLIHEILVAKGLIGLRFSLYQPDLNLIELIRSQQKRWVGSHDVTFKTVDMLKHCEQRFSKNYYG